MAVNAERRVIVKFTGDYIADLYNDAAENAASPGEVENIALALGANTITPPTGATAVTILPPAGNVVLITAKGISADTGIVLHPTDPTSIGINSAASSFVLSASATVTVRLVWS